MKGMFGAARDAIVSDDCDEEVFAAFDVGLA